MHLSAASLHEYYRPTKCQLRVYLKAQRTPEDEPGPYEDVIRTLGQRHEQAHVDTLAPVVDLRDGELRVREARTKEAVTARTGPIYQPVLRGNATLEGTACTLIGIPDLIIPTDGGDVIRDCKMSRRITEKDHPEILRQMALYSLLYRETFGKPPAGLQVLAGTGELIDLVTDGEALQADSAAIIEARQWAAEPYTPIGWTYCGDCCFHTYCWSRAEERQDPSLLGRVDRGLALQLHQDGINSVSDLVKRFDAPALAEYKRPWGKKMQRVGATSEAIICSARAFLTRSHIVLQRPALPDDDQFVMFDLEGLPPQLDELDKVYLWGMQVMGEPHGEYHGVTAGFGESGDRDGWFRFLQTAHEILAHHPAIRFVHYAAYERTKLRRYVDRYGDDDRGTAARVEQQLLDLLPVIQNAVALPTPSYSLKVVEQYVGFKRSQEEYGGDWSMAKYIEATEMEDEAAREAVLDQIRTYNQEDLEATWAVLKWIRTLQS